VDGWMISLTKTMHVRPVYVHDFAQTKKRARTANVASRSGLACTTAY